MPQYGSGLAVGQGLANAADNFVRSFTQVRMQKHQEKLLQNEKLIGILTSQLQDDNIPFDQRAAMIDEIPGLLGIKNMPRSLSQQLGLDKFNQQQVADPNKPAQAATPNSTATDTNVIDAANSPNASDAALSMNPNIQMQGTSAVAAGQIRQGELTPADLKLQRALKLKQADSADDINKQAQLLKLQQKLYIKGGYNVIPGSGFLDDSGNYFMKAMNTAGETKNISFGKVKPAAIAIQEEKNKGLENAPKGKLGQLQAAKKVIDEYEADPTSHPLSEYQANKAFYDDFEKSGVVKTEYAAALHQGVTGTKPIQPGQDVDNKLAAAKFKAEQQKEIDQHQANIIAAQKVISNLTPRKKAADAELANATKAFDDMIASGDYTPDDAEYKAANSRKVRAQQQVNTLSQQFNKAVSTHAQSNVLLKGAQARLTNTGNVVLTDQQKSVIGQIRAKNPEQTKDLTDEQILNIVASKKQR